MDAFFYCKIVQSVVKLYIIKITGEEQYMKKMISILTSGILLMSAASNAIASGFITGGDMTEVHYIEDLGGVYKDFDGNKVDPFEFMASEGVNMARIRLSNYPGKGRGDGTYYLPDGYQDGDDCFELCKCAKAAGMGIEFTFNYSDYWSNGERQIVPADWAEEIRWYTGNDITNPDFLKSMTAAQKKEIQDWLVQFVYNYTESVMQRLKRDGTLPEYVSLGNEINGGMLFPFGNAYAANMNKDNFELVFDDKKDDANDIKCADETEYLLKFLKSGYDAVKAVSPDTKVIIHLATAGNGSGDINDGRFTWLMDKFNSAGVVDVLGASYYPAWSGATADKAAAFCNRMYARYNKPVMIMETGFNWNPTKKNGGTGQLADIDAYAETCPPSKEGQQRYLTELFGYLTSAAAESCVGVLYWDPCMIHVEDPNNANESLSGWAYNESDDKPAGNVVENTTLFDFDGVALPAFKAFNTKYDLTGTVGEAEKITAVVHSGEQSTRSAKAMLIVAVYDNNTLKEVKTDTKTLAPNSEVDLEVEKPEGEYKVFLWNGNDLSPITQEAQ